MLNQIEVVGIGLDGAVGLSATVKEIIATATVLVGSRRHLSYFAAHPAQKVFLDNIQLGIESIKELLNRDDEAEPPLRERVVILATGDPLFFGLGRLLLQNFPPEQLNFHPHFCSVQLAFNRLKIPWQDSSFISVHGRSTDELIRLLKQGAEKIAVLTDSHHNPAAIARLYLSWDLPVSYAISICENLGSDNEKIANFAPEEITELANLNGEDFSALNILVFLRQESINDSLNLDSLPLLGLPDRTFLSFRDRPSLMTKKEVRLTILGELALHPKQIVWDIGAGTGSVSIEIARLCPDSRIFATEKTSIGISLIAKNCQRLQVDNVTAIHGKAPEALLNLPHPERIFIGGSGGNLVEILDFCNQRITSKGKIVMAFATIEHCHQALTWFSDNSWNYHLLQLQISRSTPVQHLTRFTPLNPVTVITAVQKIDNC